MKILNSYGPDSKTAKAFLRKHGKNRELIKLCEMTRVIRAGVASGEIPAAKLKYKRLVQMRLKKPSK